MEKRYFKNLDGLRFIAAATVAFSHLETLKQYRNIPFIHNRFFDNAPQLAVTFFFVLSGFLIMWWFLEETGGNTTKINIWHFYLNRMGRTWPLYFLVVFTSIAISLYNGTFRNDPLATKRYIAYLFFLPNTADIFFGKDIYLSPTWSLAVEECFYLLFPFLLVKIWKENTVKTFVILAFIFGLLSAVFSNAFFSSFFWDYSQPQILRILIHFFDSYRFYSFFLGAIAATLMFYKYVPAPMYSGKKIHAGFTILLALLFLDGITFSFFTQQIYSVFFATFLFLITANNYTLPLLNSRPIIWAGKRSYSIYLLHVFIILRLINQGVFLLHTNYRWMSILISWILYLCAILITAHLSYQLFENPIRIAVRKRLLKRGRT